MLILPLTETHTSVWKTKTLPGNLFETTDMAGFKLNRFKIKKPRNVIWFSPTTSHVTCDIDAALGCSNRAQIVDLSDTCSLSPEHTSARDAAQLR